MIPLELSFARGVGMEWDGMGWDLIWILKREGKSEMGLGMGFGKIKTKGWFDTTNSEWGKRSFEGVDYGLVMGADGWRSWALFR